MDADLPGGNEERLVLDRAGAHEDLPVRLPRDLRESRGQRDDGGAADGEDPEELGKAEVVAHGQPDLLTVTELGDDDVAARLLGLRLAVLDPVDHDVEHVDLAVDAADLPVGSDVDARVRELVATLPALDDGAGDQVDAQLLGDLARPRDGRAVQRLGARGVVLVGAEDVELLGEDDEVRAVGGGRAGQLIRRREVPLLVFIRVELDGRCAHPATPPPAPLTD